jgi:Zn-dependent M28 family amino/carboxypeptidase
MGTRFALAENRRNVAMNIKKRFERLGYTNVRLDSFPINKLYRDVSYYHIWQYNVIASITGSVNPDSICIIGGHYDNILKTGDPFTSAPGANDNASGVAAAIEIARVFQTNNYKPVNSIEFIAFGAEELGLFGSYYYSDYARLNSKKIKLMLNNDMIAFQPSSQKADWSVNIMDYDNSHNLRKEAEVMSGRFTNLKTYNYNTYNKQSDSYPFFVNGFKALFFISASSDPYYHTADDTVDKYNFEFCREIVKLNCAILIDKN